jgi:biopolymer transport protein ExbB/TolQ
MIHQLFKIMTWMGSEWVLWTLFLMSVLTVWVILQRWFEIRRLNNVSSRFWDEQADKWFRGGSQLTAADIEKLKASYPCLESEALEVTFRAMQSGSTAPSEVVAAYLDQRKLKLEKFVAILGTIGANAPFVGLLGTVLGIIRAFSDMAVSGLANSLETIGGGISEALVATAIGLFVAIPAVIFFNVLNKRISNLIRKAQNLSQLVLGQSNKQ